ncbi:MAG: diguanylate cyclase [Nitrospirae bacterium]|nr:diguanylate cyclase [Nitrospirota bacterium]
MEFRLSQLTDYIPSSLLDKLIPKELFSRLDIASKMLLGYLVLVVLTVVVVVYALVSLQNLNSLNASIVTIDVPIQEASDKMQEGLLAQDTYEKRFLIFNDNERRTLFLKRGEEFREWLDRLHKLPDSSHLPLGKLTRLYQEYSDSFAEEVQLMKAGNRDGAARISNGPMKELFEQIRELLQNMLNDATSSRDKKMKQISDSGKMAFLITALLSVLSLIFGILGSVVVTHHISSSIKQLSVATGQIAEGNFDYDPQIRSKDEIGSLATAFVEMGKRLRKLEEMYLDASPLTRLPGGVAIENVLKKRLESKQPLAFCVFDLDNFKVFNDRYGYAHGSEVIKETARIIEQAVAEKGTPEDFVGHVGGDDFVVITVPDRMRAVCEEVIARFDRRIPEFYDEMDRTKGHILGKTRQGVEMKFPLMTISIAIVTNERRLLTNPLQTSEIAAELKDYAKTIPKSVFVIDKRRA